LENAPGAGKKVDAPLLDKTGIKKEREAQVGDLKNSVPATQWKLGGGKKKNFTNGFSRKGKKVKKSEGKKTRDFYCTCGKKPRLAKLNCVCPLFRKEKNATLKQIDFRWGIQGRRQAFEAPGQVVYCAVHCPTGPKQKGDKKRLWFLRSYLV